MIVWIKYLYCAKTFWMNMYGNKICFSFNILKFWASNNFDYFIKGIRRELVNRVAGLLHQIFTFNPKSKDRLGDLNSKITSIAKEMEGFRKSFEYIEDYINIPGLRLWQESNCLELSQNKHYYYLLLSTTITVNYFTIHNIKID